MSDFPPVGLPPGMDKWRLVRGKDNKLEPDPKILAFRKKKGLCQYCGCNHNENYCKYKVGIRYARQFTEFPEQTSVIHASEVAERSDDGKLNSNFAIVKKISDSVVDDFCYRMDVYKGIYHTMPERPSDSIERTLVVMVDSGCDNNMANIKMARARGETLLPLPTLERYDAVDAAGRLISRVEFYILKKIGFGTHVEVRTLHCMELSDLDEYLLGKRWIKATHQTFVKVLTVCLSLTAVMVILTPQLCVLIWHNPWIPT